MHEILALAVKDLRLLVRDKVGFFFAFVFPILYASLFGAIMSSFSDGGDGGSGMAIVVVDEDGTTESAKFVKTMEEADEFNVTQAPLEQASDLVRRGKQAAFVVLPPGFGDSRRNMFWGDPPALKIGIDPARQAEAAMLKGLLTKTLFEGMQEAFTNPEVMNRQIDESMEAVAASKDMDPITKTALSAFLPALKGFMASTSEGNGVSQAFRPASIETIDIARQRSGPRNAYSISFPQGIVWGIMGCAAGFGISLVVERTRGTLVRLRMAPINRSQVLAGKGLACLATTIGVATVLFTFGFIFFSIRPDSYAHLALAVVCVALCFVGIMMLLSVSGKTEQSAGGIGWAVLMVLAMIGGGMVPLFFLPKWLQTIGSISPIKWSILAMEGAIWRNFSFTEMLMPCGVLLAFGAVCFAVGARIFRWTQA